MKMKNEERMKMCEKGGGMIEGGGRRKREETGRKSRTLNLFFFPSLSFTF